MLAPPTPFEKKLGFKLEIEINSNKNNPFTLNFNADTYDNLSIQAKQKNDLFHKSFYNNIPITKIKENKYFSLFDDLKEICNELSERIKSNGLKLIENLNNVIIIISLPISKIKEIAFELNEDKINEKENYNDLKNLILKMQEEINENKKEIKELKSLTDIQNNEINELKEQMKALVNNINNKDLIIENLNGSLIIDNNNDYNKLLKNWINPNKNIKAELLYRLSKDGEKISTFHKLCDNKGPTLTLFNTEDNIKGGIYTPLSWDSNSGWKNDMETFIFNLNKKQKYKKLQKNNSINCFHTHGPWVYSFGFTGCDQMKRILSGDLRINSYYEKGAEIIYEKSSLAKSCNVLEVEVYKIII